MDFLNSVLPSLTGREECEEPLFRMPLLSSLGFRIRTWAETQRWLNTLIPYLILQVAGRVLQNTLLKRNSEPSDWPRLSAQQGASLWTQWKEGWTSPEASHLQHPALSLKEIISPNLGP